VHTTAAQTWDCFAAKTIRRRNKACWSYSMAQRILLKCIFFFFCHYY
jgi:hypothetical protein